MAKNRLIAIILIFVKFVAPSAALACRVASSETPILHQRISAIPDGAMAMEIEITTDVRSPANPPLEGRIISMIRGDYSGTKVRIERQVISSCDGVPYVGSRGFLIGRVLFSTDDALVIDPVRAPATKEGQSVEYRRMPPRDH